MRSSAFVSNTQSLVIAIAILSTLADTASVTCRYFSEFRTHIGAVDVCSVVDNDTILVDDFRFDFVVDSLTGERVASNPRVQHFAAENKHYHFMPQGLAQLFSPKLLGIEIINSKLRAIRLKDMRPFRHLGYLNLRENDIECLDSDVFRFNYNLQFVSLRFNNVRRIDSKIFQSLHYIQQFWFHGNQCFSQNANNMYEIPSLVRGINLNCAPPTYGETGTAVMCEELIEIEKDVANRVKRTAGAQAKCSAHADEWKNAN